MKLIKFFLPIFVSPFFLANICIAVNENEQIKTDTLPARHTNDNPEVKEHLVRPTPEISSEILDAIKNSKAQENNAAKTTNETNNSSNTQNTEQTEKPKISKPKQSVKKKEEKKIEKIQSHPQEQNTAQTQEQPSENNDQQDDKPLPEVSYDEVEKFKNRIPTSNQKDGKEYIIRGLVSMMLVIAGAILLVVVIITNVGNKKGKYGKKRNKNYYDDKF